MLTALAALALLFPTPTLAFTVTEFHPQGLIRSPRQVRVVFSEPMIPFGDPRGIEPFTAKCSAKGRGLWEDARTWMYEFEKELPAGENCQFSAKKDLRSDKGGAWTGKTEFSFETGGPAVKRSEPYEGDTLEQKPAFLLHLDGPVDSASVEKNAYLLVEKLSERIPLKVLSEKVRNELVRRNGRYGRSDDEGEEGGARAGKDNLIAVESSRPLPPDARLQLVWGKGIRSPKGAATSEDQMLAFRTQKDFVATFHCQRENEKAPCLPIGEMSLQLSAGVARKDLERTVLRSGSFTLKPRINDKEEFLSSLVFPGPFPPNATFALELPGALKDETGRPLSNASTFPLEVKTGGYPPLAKFPSPFGILEAGDPVLPITLRHVEARLAGTKIVGTKASLGPEDPAKLMQWVARLQYKHNNYLHYEAQKEVDSRGEPLLAGIAGSEKFELPKPSGAEAFEVVGIPLGQKGFHLVEVESQILGQSLLGKPKPMYVAAGALVTNMAVHLKWGAENSLVWVTSLSDGKPVKGARLRAADCTGKIVWEGRSDENGTALAEKFPALQGAAQCSGKRGDNFLSGLVVLAEKDGDFSFVHTSWENGIESWRFHVAAAMGPEDETMAHTVFDRTLLRAGQTVHMKHFLRERYLRGIRFQRSAMPKSVVILHSTGRKVVLPLAFSASGVAETEWKIPKDADLGGYSVFLTTHDQKEAHGRDGEEEGFSGWGPGVYQSGAFRVEEFRVPVMAGSLQWPKGTLTDAKSVSVDLSVRFLSGGGAAGLPVKLRSRATRQEGTTFANFEGYSFGNGGVKPGRRSRTEGDDDRDKREITFPEQKLSLDQSGGARATVSGLPGWDRARISLEAEYRDPNGEVQTVSRDTLVFPAGALVGIQPDGWVAQKDQVKFKVAVVSPDGKPLAGRPVSVQWLSRENFSHRKRIVGGFYAYENFEEISEKGQACRGTSNDKGIVLCEGKAPGSGNMVLVAETEEGGHRSRAHQNIFVAGSEEWWFSQENDDRIDLLPEKKAYEPGETARLQVRSPFRNATALITVEREGVIERYVRTIEGKNPVIEVPVKASFAPNVFISALLVRGRVGEPKATAFVDLARPAHKLGIAEISVGWRAHRLNVTVDADKPEYKVREKARVHVHVVRASDGQPAGKGEVLLLAIDEALLELMPNHSWDLLDAMMGNRTLKVQTSTAQSQVIGKRHFGVKALPPGGGGGRSSARELFDTLLFWKAVLPLNEHGDASAEVPMNDSLSSFRIVAVASEEADRFGSGFHSVRTRQDLMLFSGVSPLARLGDQTNPEVTVRNSSGAPLRAEVQGLVDGNKLGAAKSLELPPGTSQTVSWPWLAPMRGAQQNFEFSASAGEAQDTLKVTQKLEPPLRETVLQSTLERVEGKLRVPVAQAVGSVPGKGGITVKLESKLASNLEGVRRYMAEYPFGCLEQQASKAVALRDASRWKAIVASLSSYLDGAGLLKYFPEATSGSDSLTSYFLSIAGEAGYAIPENDLKRLVTGLQGFVTGTYYYSGFVYPAADLAIRKLAAMEALSRYQSFNPSYLGLIQIQPELWPMSAVLDWYSLLGREQKIPDREKRLAHAEQVIRSKLEWRGTVVGFKGEAPLWWLMNSMDEDANKLLLAAAGEASWNADIARLVRGSLARQKQGHWDLTTANAWGVLAMERFSEKHEKEPVSGSTESRYGGQTQTAQWAGPTPPPPQSFRWAGGKSDLEVVHSGGGKPWAFLEVRAAVKLTEPIFKGYQLIRTVKAVEQKEKGKWSRGDVYRVTLKVEAPADMTWVVISDPVPAGATVLGSGLGNDSAALLKGEKQKGSGWGSFEERSFSGFRSYQEYMPKGSHQIEYTVRLNAAGTFQLPNSRVEAMYAPEMYAETPNGALTVR